MNRNEQFVFNNPAVGNCVSTPTGVYLKRKRRQKLIITMIVVGFLGFCAMIGVGIGAFLLFGNHGPLAGEPETCKEAVERLQGRGVEVLWTANNHSGQPSVYVFQCSNKDYPMSLLVECAREGVPQAPTAIITQHETVKDAKESAGTSPNAFSKGRFTVTSGNKEFLATIKSKL